MHLRTDSDEGMGWRSPAREMASKRGFEFPILPAKIRQDYACEI